MRHSLRVLAAIGLLSATLGGLQLSGGTPAMTRTVAAAIDPDDVIEELPDAVPAPEGAHILRVHRDTNGSFLVPVVVNGVRIDAIVDTGATETVLSGRDARRTGAVRAVVARRRVIGVGGALRMDVARITSVEVGGQRLGGMTAAIAPDAMPHTLLGARELDRLGRIEMEGGVLTIRPARI